ncbi:hypothetical protein E2C01_038853 [Portunus trituberculatus]|uniref:Secreted protein n=1 Tax=Portunus trituberculatus TaxID=210409 RepID=A0A5B7FI26_PORTR|nr:hypothetical protein [Portunus trituberculatus]
MPHRPFHLAPLLDVHLALVTCPTPDSSTGYLKTKSWCVFLYLSCPPGFRFTPSVPGRISTLRYVYN